MFHPINWTQRQPIQTNPTQHNCEHILLLEQLCSKSVPILRAIKFPNFKDIDEKKVIFQADATLYRGRRAFHNERAAVAVFSVSKFHRSVSQCEIILDWTAAFELAVFNKSRWLAWHSCDKLCVDTLGRMCKKLRDIRQTYRWATPWSKTVCHLDWPCACGTMPRVKIWWFTTSQKSNER